MNSAAVAEHLRRGAAARKAGRWKEAADAYRAAWEQDPRPEIAGELGVCEVALGRYRDAAEHLYLGLAQPESLSRDQRRRFVQAQERAEREVAAVALSARPASAEVIVDGRSLGEPRPTYVVFLEPGPHTFRARLAGHEDAVVMIATAAGTPSEVGLELVERRPPPVVSAPAPAQSAPVMQCRPGEDCSGKLATTFRIVGFTATGAGIVAGAGMAIGAAVLQDELKERSAVLGRRGCSGKGTIEPCNELVSLWEMRDTLASGAVLSFIAAGAIGAATVSSFWWAPTPRSEHAVRVAPVTSRSHVGVAVHGRW